MKKSANMAGSLQRKDLRVHLKKRRQLPDKSGIDGNKKAAMMGGSVQRKAFGVEVEPASTASK
ncbi:hypothetical protein [Xanthomonas tesorieronis]|uniref:hypothetical protein n=1 Tax=Xanthomonas tesorieronis TaxID=3160839 RepID=UPI0035112C4E